MASLIDGVFAEILRENRDRFNSKFVYARHQHPRLCSTEFSGQLLRFVAPTVEAVAQVDPTRVGEVADVLYDLSLELCGLEYLGSESRCTQMAAAWEMLFTRLPHLVAQKPAVFTAAVCNAVCNMAASTEDGAERWMSAMVPIGEHCQSVARFLDAGTVMAWTCGLAHFRDGALEIVKTLPSEIVQQVFGVKSGDHAARLAEDPWYVPRTKKRKEGLELVRTVGQFRGFGGQILRPPKVALIDGRFYVKDGVSQWLLSADAYGATLQRVADLPNSGAKKESGCFTFTIDRRGNVEGKGHSASFPVLSKPTSSASNDSTLAVTISRSHSVFLIAVI